MSNALKQSTEPQAFKQSRDPQARKTRGYKPGDMMVTVHFPMVGSDPMWPLCELEWSDMGESSGWGGWLYNGDRVPSGLNVPDPETEEILGKMGLPAYPLNGVSAYPPPLGEPAISNSVRGAYYGRQYWGEPNCPHRYLNVTLEVETSARPDGPLTGYAEWPEGGTAQRYWKWEYYYSPLENDLFPVSVVGSYASGGGTPAQFIEADWQDGAWTVDPVGADMTNGLGPLVWACDETLMMSAVQSGGTATGTLSITETSANVWELQMRATHLGGVEHWTKITITKSNRFACYYDGGLDQNTPEATKLWKMVMDKLDSFNFRNLSTTYSGYSTTWLSGDPEEDEFQLEDGYVYEVKPVYGGIYGDMVWEIDRGEIPTDAEAPVGEGSTPETPLPPTIGSDFYFNRHISNQTVVESTGLIFAGAARMGTIAEARDGDHPWFNVDWKSLFMAAKVRFTEPDKYCAFSFISFEGYGQTDPLTDNSERPYNMTSINNCEAKTQRGLVIIEPRSFLYNSATDTWDSGLLGTARQKTVQHWHYQPPGEPPPPTEYTVLPDYWLWPPCCLPS